MEKETGEKKTSLAVPDRFRVTLLPEEAVQIDIPKEGFSTKGFFTLFVIFFWLLMILVWTVLLMQYGLAWTLLSIPFWLLGGVTLRLSLSTILASQQLIISRQSVLLKKKQRKNTASVEFKHGEISDICLVEGTYKTLSGITRKGVYPAFISNGEAFAFGERCTNAEKQWLLDKVKTVIKTCTTTTA
ncbi:MAG: hypothetical protein H6541_07105 [Lentimicrobiaceae bacterium]|nr:hypothetical protein [Lentimicrobiaceae bacterium]MCB9024528.1 hypothetical protein [Lentimicrobiaceae bacterium]MCO5266358.1 hypothetical protein [Lentimicrobium sp.]HPG33673.1 hypothetical protein [Lentimicrobium sp.]